MRLSPEAVAFFIQEEGFRAKWYTCPAGKPTIGIGHVILPGEEHYYKESLTEAAAIELLQKDIQTRFGAALTRSLTAPATPNQYAAMVSLCYNIGTGGFAKSSVCRLHNTQRATPAQMSAAFGLWCKITDPQTKQKVTAKGLVARRKREAALYYTT
jgi:lysozyme